MKKIRELLKLRKQDDFVKIIFIYIIISIAMIVTILINGLNMYKTIYTSKEYVLTSAKEISDNGYENLKKIKNISSVSKQKTESISFGGESFFQCVKVSTKYMKEVFGVKNESGMSCFYVSRKVIDEMKNNPAEVFGENDDNETKSEKIQENKKTEINYKTEEEEGWKTAAAILLNNSLINDEEVILMPVSDAELSEQINGVRVLVSTQDISGIFEKEVEQKQYSFADNDSLKQVQNESNILLLKIKYEIAIAVLCISMCIFSIKRVKNQFKYEKRFLEK